LKITNGILKYKCIKINSNRDIRPTSAKVREAIFNILYSLGFNVENKNILDLFSGSGIVSFEFISRGAKTSTLVDSSKYAIKELIYNIKNLNIEDKTSIYQKDASDFLKITPDLKAFDLIYMDPPYNYSNYLELTNIIIENKNKDTILIVEAKDSSFLDDNLKEKLIKEKKYGTTVLLFF